MQGLAYVDKLFDMKRKIHEKKGSDFDAIKKFRLEKEKPVLNVFWNWLDCQTAIKNSRMYKALIYIQNRRPFLETYLEDGGCSFNNNTSLSDGITYPHLFLEIQINRGLSQKRCA